MSNQIDLTDEEFKRYDRHLKLADFGLNKQLKLKQSKVLLVGAGGLGCPIGLYLAAAGVGTIGIADDDKIDISNLHRQIAFSVDEIGQSKSKALAKRLKSLNNLLHVEDHAVRVNESNIEDLIKNYDLVIDGTDNFASRFLLADVCFLNKTSYIHASVYQYQGQISLFLPNQSPCFRCLFRYPPDACALPACGEAGILGVVTGVIGVMAAAEAVKHLTGLAGSLCGKVLIYNALTQQSKQIAIEPDKNCPLCSKQSIKGVSIMPVPQEEKSVTQSQATQWINNEKDLCLLDVRETPEYEQGHIDNAALLPLSILKTLFNQSANSADQYLNLLPENKEKKILCYCRRGGRSLQAADILRHAGFTNTFSMDGGFEAWQEVNDCSIS